MDHSFQFFCSVLLSYNINTYRIDYKLEPWASKTARHNFERLDMQRNE